MLYYRTHASRAGEMPPELAGWRPPVADVQLSEQIIGEHRIVAVAEPFIFAPPTEGWTKLCAGWEVAAVGVFNQLWHAKLASSMLCRVIAVSSGNWIFPAVLTDDGLRQFKVVYGGPDFAPRLTTEQQSALAVATEARTCRLAGTMPSMSTQAQWAASLLGLTYCMSPASFGVVGLPEDVIETTLAVAGGYYAARED